MGERHLEKISDLKSDSAPGPDGICPLFLKETDKIIAKSLKIIFESTLKEKKCPSKWKEANVVAIYKKGPKGNPENYRPVSLTSIVCKIFESIVKDALNSHLERNKLISDSQHGFMKGWSCTTNLVEFFDKVTESVDRGEAVDIFYLDFAKAFDKVPRERLLEKLRAKGVDGEVLAWLRDWLTDRKQRVVCEGNFSESIQVESGVPQGTVLGPPLFNVFIDDIDEVAKIIELLLKFSDDTKGMKIIRGEEDRKILQETLDGLVEWAEKWGMKFNLAKCKIMHVGRNNPGYVYTMGGVALEEVEEERDVGVTVHKSLKPALQCRRAANTASAVLRQIAQNFHFRDRNVFIRLYKQYVRPHVEFSTPAWSPWLRGDVEVLESVQRRAVKMVAGLKGTTYEDRCRELNIETLEKRRQDQDMKQTFKIVRRKDRLSPSKLFKFRQENVQTRTARDCLHLRQQVSRLDVRRNAFSQRVTGGWNKIKIEDKMGSFAMFKRSLRNLSWTGGEPHDDRV